MSSKTAADAQARGWSLALLLGVVHASTAFLLVLLTAFSLLWAVEAGIEREDRHALEDRVMQLARVLQERPDDLDELRREVGFLGDPLDRMFARITDEAGRTVAETTGMPAVESAAGGPHLVSAADTTYLVLARDMPGARRSRITVALDRTDDEQFMRHVRTRTFVVVAVAALVSVVLGWIVARLGTAPIAKIAATARRVGTGTLLSERIDARRFPAELGELAATFNEMLSRLEEHVARISQFSADVAHELRTPLTVLRNELEVSLRGDADVAQLRDAVASGLEECDRLSRLVERLLFLARTEDTLTSRDVEVHDLRDLLAGVVDLYAALASEHGVGLELVAEGELACRADRTLMQRAVSNLVENSLRYTPAGGSIAVSARAEGDLVRVEVADTGVGIPPEHLPRVFDRLYRVDMAREARHGGSGLGLAIVHRIAKLHGGTVEARSVVGSGTTITIVLPRGVLLPT